MGGGGKSKKCLTMYISGLWQRGVCACVCVWGGGFKSKKCVTMYIHGL